MVDGALIRYVLFNFVRDLNAAQKNMQRNLNREHMLFVFELDHNAVKSMENIMVQKVQTLITVQQADV